HHKKRNWCQIGVKTEKITISKEIRYCKPLILKGLQKKSQKISTHLLTVLTIHAILKTVIRNYLYKTQPLRVTFLKSRGSCVLYIKIGG
ncbi:MAG: hypothetical protein U0M38_04730, partial [Blautia faecis]|nr:hypothetical protein [Blautia faecis]